MKQGEACVVLTGFCFVCVKVFVTTSGYKHFLEASAVFLVVLLAFIVERSMKSQKPSLFRCRNAGLWTCVLLPSVANGMEVEDRSLLWSLVLATFVSYVYSEGYSMSRSQCVLVLVVYTCITADMIYHKPCDGVIISVCSLVYMFMLHEISSWFKKSFTFGEASIVIQLYISQTYRGIRNIKSSDPLEKMAIVVYVGLHLAVLSLYVLHKKQFSVLLIWTVMAVIGLVFFLTVCVLYLEVTDIHRLLNYVIVTDVSAVLLCWWFLWLLISVLVVCFHGSKKSSYCTSKMTPKVTLEYENVNTEQADLDTESEEKYKQLQTQEVDMKTQDASQGKRQQKSSKKTATVTGSHSATSVRKLFHVAMICVYVPGLLLSPSLLYLASITVAAVLIILEVIRVLKLPPFGSILDEYLWVFLDDQDTGDLILTPIYLLVGCSVPLWWNYKLQRAPCSLSIYAGLISVGIGDGMASVIGRKYGKHKWPGKKKSIEGTSASIISQIIAIQLLSYCKIPGAVVTMEMIFCITLISLLEAFTNQIDNLVVPMFAWVLLAIVEPTY